MKPRLGLMFVLVALLLAGCTGDSKPESKPAEPRCLRESEAKPAGNDSPSRADELVFDVAPDYDEAGYDIVSVRANGRGFRTLTRGLAGDANNPVVSPDGRRIAFDLLASAGGTEASVHVMAPDGTDRRRLVPPADGHSYAVGWSPNGKEVLYALLDASASMSPWSVNVDGGGKRRLVRGAEHGAWSPDGSTIAFVRSQGTEHPAIHVLDVRDGRSRLLARDGDLPRWTPDSTCVVFDKSLQGRRSGFYVVDRDGGRPRLLTRFGGDHDPYLVGVSPDGRWVLAGYLPGISRISLADGKLQRLTNGRRDWAPAWSPDGTRIAFERDGNIWVMDANGANERLVARAPGVAVYDAPHWRR